MSLVTAGSLTITHKRFLVSFQIEDCDFRHHPKLDEPNLSLPVCYAEGLKVDLSWIDRFVLDAKVTRKMEKAVVLTREEEFDIFLRYNWYRYQIRQLQDEWKATGSETIEDDLIDRLIELHDMASRIEAQIDAINTAMKVGYCTSYYKGKNRDESFCDHWSAVNLAMLKAIRGFDISRGNKFSTYYHRAALSCIIKDRTVEKRHKSRFRAASSYVCDDEIVDFMQNIPDKYGKPEKGGHDHPDFGELYQIVSGQIEMPKDFALDATERQVLAMRYLDGKDLLSDYVPVQAIANKLAANHDRVLSKERVRQILASAHRKIRIYLEIKNRKAEQLKKIPQQILSIPEGHTMTVGQEKIPVPDNTVYATVDGILV